MFSLWFIYKRNFEIWCDMWSTILRPLSELPPSPSSFGHSPKPDKPRPESRIDETSDKP